MHIARVLFAPLVAKYFGLKPKVTLTVVVGLNCVVPIAISVVG